MNKMTNTLRSAIQRHTHDGHGALASAPPQYGPPHSISPPNRAELADDAGSGRRSVSSPLLPLGRALHAYNYRHITPTPATHARVNARPGNAWAHDLNGALGWSRPFREDVIPSSIFRLMHEADILAPHQDGWRSVLRASTLGDRIYFHSAWPTTADDAVFFGPDTYRYVQAMWDHVDRQDQPIRRAVDIGAGSGAGAIELALRLPQAEVIAVDINPKALALTRINAELAGVSVEVRHSNLLAEVPGGFDLIVANPPYMQDSGPRAYRHGGGKLGTGLSLDIIATALQRLNPGGTLLLYTGTPIVSGTSLLLEAARPLLEAGECQWHYRELDPDVFGEELESEVYAEVDRIAVVVLTLEKEPAG